MGKPVYITASAHTQFAIQAEQSVYSLMAAAINQLIDEAAVDASFIGAVFVANYSGGSFNNQEHLAPYAVSVNSELRYKPMYRAEGACASGSSAIHLAQMAIQSGQIDSALVVGVEKMSNLATPEVTKALAKASYYPLEGAQGYTFPGLFAEFAKGWLQHYKQDPQKLRQWLAEISSKAYALGELNPMAQLRKARSAESILSLTADKNPLIAGPLRLHDCSPISDGAAAILLSKHKPLEQAVELCAMSTCCDYLNIVDSPKSNYFLEGASRAVREVLQRGNLTLQDIQFAEVHDCFTIAEFLMYSALGLTEPGREFEALQSGDVLAGGPCVINPSGGLKSKGHPVGATGVSMHALAYRQLCQQASGFQVDNAANALIVNLGGSAATNVASLLKRHH